VGFGQAHGARDAQRCPSSQAGTAQPRVPPRHSAARHPFGRGVSLCRKIPQCLGKIFKRSLITSLCTSSSNCRSNCHFKQQSKKRFSHRQRKCRISKFALPRFVPYGDGVRKEALSLSRFLTQKPSSDGELTEEKLLPASPGSRAKQLLLLQAAAPQRSGKSSARAADTARKGRERCGPRQAAGGHHHADPHRSPPAHALQHLHLTHCRYNATNQRA